MNDELEVLRLLFALGGLAFTALMVYVTIAAISRWRGEDDEQWRQRDHR